MKLTSIAINRPVLMLVTIGTFLLVGIVAWTRLGVDLLPALDSPLVVVSTAYPGAGPAAIDRLVTKTVEDAVASMSDIDYIVSNSVEGASTVKIIFTDKAAQDSAIDVQRRVNAIRDRLPAGARDPVVSKFDPNAQPVLQLTVTGGANRDLGALQQIAEDTIQKRLEATDGVAQVSVLGGLVRELQVQVNQQKLEARGLSILQVNQALSGDNLDVPTGNVSQRGQDWTVRLDNQAQTPADLNDVLVARTSNGPVLLGDVATVVETYKKVSNIERTNSRSALGISVIKQASANTVKTADNVRRTLAGLKSELPPDVQISVASDASVFTRNSLSDVQRELLTAVILTGLVLLLFLHTLRSTIIVLLAIPTSLIATLGVMYFAGLSLNVMSLMGLMLTVGILVDDSIVVLENIFSHLQRGEDPRQAAMTGRSEIGFAAIAITLVDVVVFAPIAFMSGMTGQYFRQFGLVVVSATLFSLFISFTLTPMLASRWFGQAARGRRATDFGWPSRSLLAAFGGLWDRGYAHLLVGYRRVLRFALGRWSRWAVVVVSLGTFAAGMLLVFGGVLSTEFMPDVDNGQLQVYLTMPPGTSLEVTSAAAQKVEERILAWPEVDTCLTSVGVGNSLGNSAAGARYATLSVQLKDKNTRTRGPDELARIARDFASDIPGARLTPVPVSLFDANDGSNRLVIRVMGDDTQTQASHARQVGAVLRHVPGTADVEDTGVVGAPELVMQIDRRQAADLGLAPGQVASVLRTALAGSTVSTYRAGTATAWDVEVILNPDDRQSVEQITEIPIITPTGAAIQLGQVAHVTQSTGPSTIFRRDRQRTVYVAATIQGRTTGDAARDIQRGLNQIQVPAGYKIAQGAAAQSQNEAFGQIIFALILSVVLMYMLMAALFESFVYPLMILLSLPLAVVGAFGALALTGNTLNMMSMIGQILLTGLVGKNAILLVDFTNTLRGRGMSRDEALLEAGPARLRPILMTTAALVLAMLPIALKLGQGGEWRAPMAVTVIGGLLTSTLLTLVLIPAVYTLCDDAEHAVASLLARLRRIRLRRAVADMSPACDPAYVSWPRYMELEAVEEGKRG